MTIGETLKRARKKRGVELDEVAKTTKIAKMFLIALETDDLSSLPRGVYARNFLRTYARYLKLDEDIITAEYHEQYQVVPVSVIHHEQTKLDDLHFRQQRNRLQLLAVVLTLILGIGGYFFWENYLKDALGTFQAPVNPTSETPIVQNPLQNPIDVPPIQETSLQNQETPEGDNPVPEGAAPGSDQPENSTRDQEPQGDTSDVTGADDEGIMDSPPAEIENTGINLPVSSLENIEWTPTNRPAENLSDMFAIQALEEVWVEVYIDEKQESYRLLPAGAVRFYRYGASNRLIVGRPSSLSVQSGTSFRSQVHQNALSLDLSFGHGGLIQAIDEKLQERRRQAEEDP